MGGIIRTGTVGLGTALGGPVGGALAGFGSTALTGGDFGQSVGGAFKGTAAGFNPTASMGMSSGQKALSLFGMGSPSSAANTFGDLLLNPQPTLLDTLNSRKYNGFANT